MENSLKRLVYSAETVLEENCKESHDITLIPHSFLVHLTDITGFWACFRISIVY